MSTMWKSGDGSLEAARLEWDESGGPVSPKFQFETHVVIEAQKGATQASLRVEHERDLSVDPPAEQLRSVTALSTEQYDTLWQKLVELDVFSLSRLIEGKLRERIGVSFNRLTVDLGGKQMEFEYTLNDMKKTEFERHARVVQLLRELVDQRLPKPTKE